MDLVLVEVAGLEVSWAHIFNLLMVMDIVHHGQIALGIVYQLMLQEKTCSLTKRKLNSQ
jgi:hypothetical protein